ncbi:hypothetical protein [Methylosarcina fibrata]|uniref:hypothetical protein n=1 Tax=Methylosarcina fibrata TaxID=105972 RepID=UPI00037CCB0F|nr:hypothetical protein [Methylosarcina fibrata]
MNIKIVKLLGAVCGALVVLLMGEWIAHEFALQRLLASINESSSKHRQIEEVPTIDLDKKTEESYADIVSRPLFIRGRKPVNEPASESAAGGTSGGGPDGVFDWQLNGVYTVNNSWSALFSREKAASNKDRFRKLTINDDLDGWKLIEIHRDKVVLEQSGGEKNELTLRKAKPKTAPRVQEPAPKPAQAPRPGHLERRARGPQPPVPQPDNQPETQPQTEVDAPENSDNE